MPAFRDYSHAKRTSENALLASSAVSALAFIRKAHTQCGFQEVLRRIQCDQKLGLRASELTFSIYEKLGSASSISPALCDSIVVVAPLTEETRHIISDAEFAAMKPTAVVINVGRGPVIDEAAPLRALTAKRIKGAGLDAFEHEPLSAGHPMYKLENILLSPHCADHTSNWQDQAMRFFLDQYGRFEKGELLKNVVNKRLGY
jgi:D-isomer specific 2-hydroxyacid dehydrogenase, NAD binding domain